MIKLSAFRSVPPFAQGLVRDVRVRWALAEAGIPYQERLIGREDRVTAAYRALQPFGQVPAIETDELKLFESGAIVLHIAETSETLMPSDANGRARTRAWMFAAWDFHVNTNVVYAYTYGKDIASPENPAQRCPAGDWSLRRMEQPPRLPPHHPVSGKEDDRFRPDDCSVRVDGTNRHSLR
jgi:hypothetical protein